eukprot:1158101-Pelagomonas_calceolata.AAC.13
MTALARALSCQCGRMAAHHVRALLLCSSGDLHRHIQSQDALRSPIGLLPSFFVRILGGFKSRLTDSPESQRAQGWPGRRGACRAAVEVEPWLRTALPDTLLL